MRAKHNKKDYKNKEIENNNQQYEDDGHCRRGFFHPT